VLRLVDSHLSGDALKIVLQRVDAAALLWRLHLLGEDVSAQAAALLAGWVAGRSARRPLRLQRRARRRWRWWPPARWPRAEAWVARCAERALGAEDARRSNHAVARELGLPLMRGLLAYARGDADGAVDLIYAVRGRRPAPGRQPRPARPDRPDAAGGRGPGRAHAAWAVRCSTSA
jgi:hypothetical protein